MFVQLVAKFTKVRPDNAPVAGVSVYRTRFADWPINTSSCPCSQPQSDCQYLSRTSRDGVVGRLKNRDAAVGWTGGSPHDENEFPIGACSRSLWIVEDRHTGRTVGAKRF